MNALDPARLRGALSDGTADRAAVAAAFDGADFAVRLVLLSALGGRAVQERLFALAGEGPRARVEELLPADLPPWRPVRFHGKNSLAAFTRFEKRMCRTEDGAIIGYNHTGVALLMTVVGPGYFQVHADDAPLGGVAIDYREEPTRAPPGWPRIIANRRRLSRVVYYRTVDYLRPLARDCYIGQATRDGRALPNYFLLVREPVQ